MTPPIWLPSGNLFTSCHWDGDRNPRDPRVATAIGFHLGWDLNNDRVELPLLPLVFGIRFGGKISWWFLLSSEVTFEMLRYVIKMIFLSYFNDGDGNARLYSRNFVLEVQSHVAAVHLVSQTWIEQIDKHHTWGTHSFISLSLISPASFFWSNKCQKRQTKQVLVNQLIRQRSISEPW